MMTEYGNVKMWKCENESRISRIWADFADPQLKI